MSLGRIPWRMKCGAKAKSTGKPCEKWATYGTYRCRLHGGASPQALRKGEERINDLSRWCMIPAYEALVDILENSRNRRLRLEVALAILQTAGVLSEGAISEEALLEAEDPLE